MTFERRSPGSNRLALLAGTAALSYLFAGTAYGQETPETEPEETIEIIETIDEIDADDEAVQDKITVTGSRIARSTFTSVSPVQIITTEFSREIGLVDPADILQDSTAASGLQIDDSFQGFVLDNGPGSSTLSLRALGSGRSLALINGRRIAPIGVEGAPADPSINLIPASFVGSYEILLDGASSIYGSDAVAGVANVILRNDYDGFEVGGDLSMPQHGGGEFMNIYGSWGKQFDKGFIAAAVDYEQQTRLQLNDRDWSDDCIRLAEVTESGEVRQNDLSTEFDYPGMGISSCEYFPLSGRMSLGSAVDYGSVYYTPGFTNTGIPGYSESALYGVMFDGNSDGLADFSFYDYTTNGTEQDRAADIIGESDAFSVMLLGDYDINTLGNATVYGEAMYIDSHYEAVSPPGQIFQEVPADNPYNPCNPNGVNGVDCGEAITNYLLGPDGETTYNNFVDYYGGGPDALDYYYGTSIVPGATGAIPVTPIVAISGDRDNVESDLSQFRLVGGLRGDLEFINAGSLTDWTYDVSFTYSKSEGTSKREGIREDRLLDSLNTSVIDPVSGNVVCGVDTSGDGIPDGFLADGTPCVPVNFFADSVMGSPVGNFETQAERDYLFGSREFETTYEQTVLSAYASGSLFDLPGGTAAGVVGVEYRKDELDSQPNAIASEGLLWGYFKDRGAFGSLDVWEAYGEIEMPLLADVPGATELTLNLSGRYTDTEYAGTATTYAAKAGWRPVNSLLLRGTLGTSFRAPNVREQFLLGQSGFSTLSDPCLVPEAAYDPIGGYDASQDSRDQIVIDNCIAAGLDPTTFGEGAFGAYSVEVFQTGATANPLDPEESESFSYGFVFEQPWTDAFEMTLGVTYYNIEITDAIVSQSPASVVYDCYVATPDQQSPFCGNITRDADGYLDEVDYEYFNVAEEVSSGYDINFLFEKDFVFRDRDATFTIDMTANRPDEVSYLEDPTDPSSIEHYVGTFGIPEWNVQTAFRITYDDYRFTWNTDYMTAVEQREVFIDPYSSFTEGGGAYTCLGEAYGDEYCREIGYADDYITHDISIAYNGEDWGLVLGVRNLFDQDPPFVSPNEVLSVNGANAPLGYGYDLIGRTFFLSTRREF